MLFVSSWDYLATADLSKVWGLGGTPTVGAFGRNSTNGLRLTTATSAVSRGMGNQTTITIGAAGTFASLPSVTRILMSFLDGVNHQCEVEMTTAGKLQIARNGTILAGPGTTVLSTGTFYYLEFKAFIDNTTGSATLKINGTQELTVSGADTQNTANAFADTFYLGASAANTDWDDLYVLNASGAVNNDFLGDLRIQCIFADGAGGNTQWTPLSGSNYANVNSTTPDDDTTYNSDATPGDRDTYTFGALSPSTASIKAVQIMTYARKDDGGTRTIAPVIRIGTTNYDQSNLPNLSTSYQYLPLVVENSPATTAPFTLSEVNGFEVGEKVIA